MKNIRLIERGSVSLFIVIFSALLITATTVAFVRIMIQNQQQATSSDLSQSALDSAYAGIEDAKRLILMYQQQCHSDTQSEKCRSWHALMDGKHCDTIQKTDVLDIARDAREVLIKQADGDKQLDQAYTCVKILLDTPNYIGALTPATSRLVPLEATAPFDEVTIKWFSQKDLQTIIEETGSSEASAINLSPGLDLPKLADWPSNRPAVLRVQLIQVGSSFMLSDFDRDAAVFHKDGADEANRATLFLMPSTIGPPGAGNVLDFTDDYISGALHAIECDETFSTTSTENQYACEATIRLPKPIGADDQSDRTTAYLRIGTIYNTSTTFHVSMAKDGQNVNFSGVQPIVDSTGRANDLFRRIMSRVEVGTNSASYVEAAVDVSGNICKTFLVTDRHNDFEPSNCGSEDDNH